MCQHAEKHSHPESVYNISGGVLRLCGDAGSPSQERSAAILSSLRHFRLGSSVHLKKISEAAGSHGIGIRDMSSGLTTHAPSTVLAEISSPLDSIDFGPSEHRGPQLH